MYVIEERYVSYVTCLVSAGVENGRLYRDEKEQLWYSSEVPMGYDDIREACKRGELVRVTDELALKLNIANEHWRSVAVSYVSPELPSNQRFRHIEMWEAR